MTHIDLTVNKSEALSQLQSLGYQEGDKVYLRFFYPSTDIRSQDVEATETTRAIKKDVGRKLISTYPNLPWDQIKSYQEAGRGCYFVVNGQGDLNTDIKEGRSVFYEHDDLPVETQKTIWKTLGFPVPTIQIETGGKSVHSYWHLKTPCDPKEWRAWQTDCISHAQSDGSLKNPNRVMRLAGAFHIKCDVKTQERTYNQSVIYSNSGASYSFDELRSIVPIATQKTKVKTLSKLTNQAVKTVKSDSGKIPLIKCLSTSNRENIKGVSQGDRNGAACSLAADLIGTSQYLKSIDEDFEGSAYSLYESFCSSCDPIIESDRGEEIWEWAESQNPEPSLSPEYIKNCLEAWYGTDNSDDDYKNNAPIAPLEAALRGLPLPLEMVMRKKIPCYQLPSVPDTARYIAIKEAENLAFHKVQKRFFAYKPEIGSWESQEKTDLSRIVAHTLKNTDRGDAYSLLSESFIRNTIEHLPIDSSDTPNPLPKHLIPFVGTWFNKESKTFLEPSNEYFTTNPLPIIPFQGDYSRISDWLLKALKNDTGAYELIRCLFWLVLNGDVSRQVFYEIIGSGGTGKGTLATLLSSCVGEENKVSTSLCDLGNNRFEPARLLGKRLILLPDQKKMGGDSSKLKALSGGDALKFESKGDPNMFDFYLSGVMVIFANDFIRFTDESDALQRRRIPIKFDVKATEDEKANFSDFASHLSESLPQWIYHILELPQEWVYKTIAKRNELTGSAQLEQMMSANPLANWLDECILVSAIAKTRIGNADDSGLYCSYCEFCKSNGNSPMAKNNFRSVLKNFLQVTLKWSEAEINFKKTNSGQMVFGIGLINEWQNGFNPVSRDPISPENLEF